MRDFEDLFGALSEFIDLTLDAHLLDRVLDLFDIDHAFVSKRMEEIESLYCLLPSLLEAEDEIDPLMQIIGDILRL